MTSTIINPGTENTLVDDQGNTINSILDGLIRRLAVDARVTLNPVGDPVHAFFDGSPASNPATLSSFTVSAGKVLQVFGWGLSSDSAVFTVELQVDGVAEDKIYQVNSAKTSIGDNNKAFAIPIIEATAGQVVRIQRIAGDTGKNITSIFSGLEVDP